MKNKSVILPLDSIFTVLVDGRNEPIARFEQKSWYSKFSNDSGALQAEQYKYAFRFCFRWVDRKCSPYLFIAKQNIKQNELIVNAVLFRLLEQSNGSQWS